MNHRTLPRRDPAFTLIETLIVVMILGTLASIVTPQFTSARESTLETSVRAQLQSVRKQIGLYNALNPFAPYDADEPLDEFWDRLVAEDYLQSMPVNPLQESSVVAAAPALGVGWIWGLNEDGDIASLSLYAVDVNGDWFPE